MLAGAVQQLAAGSTCLCLSQLQRWLQLQPAVARTLESILPAALPKCLASWQASEASMQQRRPPQQQLPALVLPKLLLHSPQLGDCLLTQQWLWLVSAWVPPEQASK